MQHTTQTNNNLYSSHLTENDFEQFNHGTMRDDDMLLFMEHIGNCTYCAERFASYHETNLVQMPPDFKRDILTETNRISRRVQSTKQAFHRYCIQVGFSVCFALVFVFSGSHLKLSELPKKTLPKSTFSITKSMNQRLNQFTTTLSISWEELLHDKKEK